jgi:4-hydroxythreonine-4-phosphate dehydrogenase
MKPIIGITLGDLAGIGPEVVAKALAHNQVWSWCQPWVYGPPEVLHCVSKKLRLPLQESSFGISRKRNVRIRPVGVAPLHWIGCGQAKNQLARLALDCVSAAVRDVLNRKIHAIVTAPVHKAGIVKAGIPFTGHTEFLSNLTGVKNAVMMMTSSRLKIALVTTHVPLRDVAQQVTQQRILTVIELFNGALKRFGFKKPKIAVASLNPHGGEDEGLEEAKEIRLAIGQSRRGGVRVEGPISADAVFYQTLEGKYDGVVAMYHDQGLAPLKMICFDQAVNVTLGLPFVRTSPDHGTAYDIAGKGKASPKSMIEAIRIAAQLARKES